MKKQLQNDLLTFFAIREFADRVTYCPENGVEYETEAIISVGDSLDPDVFSGNPASTAKIEIIGLKREPEPNDIIRFETSSWRVVHAISYTVGVWTLVAVRNERAGGAK